MRVHPYLLPVLLLGALLGTVGLAQATGQWSISGRTSVSLENLNPADLKGWMTLQQVSAGLPIPVAELYALLHIPAEVPPTTALKDLEGLVDGFEVSTAREALAAWQAGETPAPAPTAVAPTPTPPPVVPTLTATPVVTPHTGGAGNGEGSTGDGSGPTPLPPGQVLAADQIKGRLSLADISAQCAVPLDQLLAALNLPADTDPARQVKDLIAAGKIADVTAVQAAVAALQQP